MMNHRSTPKAARVVGRERRTLTAYCAALFLPMGLGLAWVAGGGLLSNELIDVVFFVLPAVEAFAWVITRLMRPAILLRTWPYVAALGVSLACILAVAVVYALPHSPVASEGDEADPRGAYILILGVNAIFGVGVALGFWVISLVARWLTLRARRPEALAGRHSRRRRGRTA